MADLYQPKYENSWALVIGIDAYHKAGKLAGAVKDAKAVAALLIKRFTFPESNVTVLLNEAATKESILRTYLNYSSGAVGSDDRLLVFYAGHGHTHSGRRGEVGFLVPVEGTCSNLDTLIRWDELTRGGDLIPVKHLFFIMDACYGGLALTRVLPPGSMRFLGDMLRRFSRQVLAAGKADQLVSDTG